MKRSVIVVVCLIIIFIGVGCSGKTDETEKLKPGTTLHYSGTGKVFGVGVNTTVGKYEEIVIHSITGSSINLITYELTGKNGNLGSDTVSLDASGYYIREIKLGENLRRNDKFTIVIKWGGKTESFDIKNID